MFYLFEMSSKSPIDIYFVDGQKHIRFLFLEMYRRRKFLSRWKLNSLQRLHLNDDIEWPKIFFFFTHFSVLFLSFSFLYENALKIRLSLLEKLLSIYSLLLPIISLVSLAEQFCSCFINKCFSFLLFFFNFQ